MNKFCRICWNTGNWHQPTGEAANLEHDGSFVKEYGFGHEEWLFNFSWLHPKSKWLPAHSRYGYLQPLRKYLSKYQETRFDICLYTISPDKIRSAVCVIRNAFVPSDQEALEAHKYMIRRGWINEMKADLERLSLNSTYLDATPYDMVNVRFEPSDVEFFDPRRLFPSHHVVNKSARYHPFNWDENQNARLPKSIADAPINHKRKSERNRERAAIEGFLYSPRHDKLQNALDRFLRDRYGEKSVRYEHDRVDLQLRLNSRIIYFEIKIALTAKRCIREALGQLLEYSVYSTEMRASDLIIVGEHPITPDDLAYLSHLRDKYEIPVRYIQWDWLKKALVGTI